MGLLKRLGDKTSTVEVTKTYRFVSDSTLQALKHLATTEADTAQTAMAKLVQVHDIAMEGAIRRTGRHFGSLDPDARTKLSAGLFVGLLDRYGLAREEVPAESWSRVLAWGKVGNF